MDRHHPNGAHLANVSVAETLVVCPSCSACARIVEGRGDCAACGWSKVARERLHAWGDATDPYLDLPLWLVTPSGDGTMSAHNAEHLDAMEAYLRTDGCQWVRSEADRTRKLAAAARLRRRLAEA